MRTRKACCAALLVLALAVPASAGWMHTDAKPTPTPAPTQVVMEDEVVILNNEPAPDVAGAVTEIALRLVQSLLTLF